MELAANVLVFRGPIQSCFGLSDYPTRRLSAPSMESVGLNASSAESLFVRAPWSPCHELWLTWPNVQDRGLRDSNVIVFRIFSSVGNLFIALTGLISVRWRIYRVDCVLKHRRRGSRWPLVIACDDSSTLMEVGFVLRRLESSKH